MKIKALLTIALLATSLLSAQSRMQKEADQLFNNFAFAKAIPAYEKLVVEGTNPTHAHKRLAECYLFMRDFEKSIPYFKRFIEKADVPSSYYLKYAMALKSAGEEEESLVKAD